MKYRARYVVGFLSAFIIEAAFLVVTAVIDRKEMHRLLKILHEDRPIRAFAQEYAEGEDGGA